jgi:tRNA G10  N-methylase Trm11
MATDLKVKHPAVFSDGILLEIAKQLAMYADGPLVLDPFAGTGGVHELGEYGWVTRGVELEHEWASMSPLTVQADARHLPWADQMFDAIVVSPAYGNRLADHHKAEDGSYRRTYKHALGRDLSDGNTGAVHWGEAYRVMHLEAWTEATRVLKHDGLFLLNIKDHQRAGKRMHVANWHYKTLIGLGYHLIDVKRIDTPHFRFGANRNVRYPEKLLALKKDA